MSKGKQEPLTLDCFTDKELRNELTKRHLGDDKPTIYVLFDEGTGEISFSAFPCDSEEYELNHMRLVEMRGNMVNKHNSVMNIVRNVLYQAGVTVVREDV